jgi:uncharacterized protein (TIGR00645 family)
MKAQIEKVIFGGRILLLPMYLGLILALSTYLARYVVEVGELLRHFLSYDETQILVAVLHHLDIIMISHLIVMVMIGGYVLFIGSTDGADEDAPNTLPKLKWLGHIDPGTLKVKMGMAIVGVSSIHLLEAFVNAGHENTDYLVKLTAIHLVFVVSTMAIAFVNRFAFSHGAEPH